MLFLVCFATGHRDFLNGVQAWFNSTALSVLPLTERHSAEPTPSVVCENLRRSLQYISRASSDACLPSTPTIVSSISGPDHSAVFADSGRPNATSPTYCISMTST